MNNDVSITLRVPEHIKERLQRSGKLSSVIRDAIDRWIESEDRALRRARQTLEEAGLYARTMKRLEVTGPTTEPASMWARKANIMIANDSIESAIATIIKHG